MTQYNKDRNELLNLLIQRDLMWGWDLDRITWYNPYNHESEIRYLKLRVNEWKLPSCPSIKDWYLVPEIEMNDDWHTDPCHLGPQYVGDWALLAEIQKITPEFWWIDYRINELVRVRISEFKDQMLSIKAIFTVTCYHPNICWGEFLPVVPTEKAWLAESTSRMVDQVIKEVSGDA